MKQKSLFFLFLFFLVLAVSNVRAINREYISIVLVGRPCGLFSNFDDVLSLCKFYDEGRYGSIEVDFGNEGLYYDPLHGPNWWSYYCRPICYGEKNRVRRIKMHFPFETEFRTKRLEAFDLINKHIYINPDILEEVKRFQEQNFGNYFMIGVHYRGTDKISEAPRLPYEVVSKEVEDKIKEYNAGSYRIFVASDEEAFIGYMVSIFGKAICYREEALRSSNHDPVHIESSSPYQCGKDAMLDALLLSRCDILIRTSSNLSRWSTYFNPAIPVYLLNRRYGKALPAPIE